LYFYQIEIKLTSSYNIVEGLSVSLKTAQLTNHRKESIHFKIISI
jgi:hypothetical protein